jgi:hypothetical protein
MKANQFVRMGLLALGLASASCSSVEQGTGTSYLIVNDLAFARGDDPQNFTSVLLSDVETVQGGSATYFNDLARVRFTLGLKDPGPTGSAAPTAVQAITVDRYHVKFVRADGRNAQGVDVPYEFDGAFTVTVSGTGQAQSGFTIVRHDAKREAPLGALRSNNVIISTIAEITFYGRDQTGHEVAVTANASVDFGNFADKTS